jgi:Flp pilus assembly CpaE family ATPase
MADGRIVTVFATKGGCGKATVASTLVVTLCIVVDTPAHFSRVVLAALDARTIRCW